jgi:hypothetical protein
MAVADTGATREKANGPLDSSLVALAALIVAIVTGTLAVLSFAWTIGWSIWQHRATTRPALAVTGSFAIIATDPPREVFAIKAVNDGPIPVTVTGVLAEAEGATEYLAVVRFVHQEPGLLPHVVPPGERWEGFTDAAQFREGIARLAGASVPPWRTRVAVRDAGSRTYDSDWLDLHPR